MQIKEFDIILDIKKYKRIEEIEVVQGDLDTNNLNITIYDGLDIYSLENLNIEIAFAKSDGTTVLQSSQDEEKPIIIEGDKIICTLKTNTIAAPGKVLSEVRILEDTRLLTSARFEFWVRKSIVNDNTIESTNEFPLLQRLADGVQGIIATEESRVTAENTRKTDESNRVQAENARVLAEQQRAITFAGYENRVSTVEDDLTQHKLDYAKNVVIPLKNEVANGNFISLDGWSKYNNITTTLIGNGVNLVSDGSLARNINQKLDNDIGDILYYKVKAKGNSGQCNISFAVDGALANNNIGINAITETNDYEEYEMIITAVYPNYYFGFGRGIERKFDTNIEYIMVFNLTKAGMTKEEVDEILKYTGYFEQYPRINEMQTELIKKVSSVENELNLFREEYTEFPFVERKHEIYNNAITNLHNGGLTANAYEIVMSDYIGQEVTVDIKSYIRKEHGNFNRISIFRWDSDETIANYNPAGSIDIGTIIIANNDFEDTLEYELNFKYTVQKSKLFIVFGYYQSTPYQNCRFATSLDIKINGMNKAVSSKGIGKTFGSSVSMDFLGVLEKTYANFKNIYVSNELFKKTINIIGDSITYGLNTTKNYGNIIAEKLNVNVKNYGISSSTIAVKETSPNERTPIVTRYSTMGDNADVVIVLAGTNDFQYDWTPLGDMTDRSNFTFYGALHNLCLGLMEKYPAKQLLFTTPIKRSQSPYTTQESTNANGKTLKEYGEIIKEVCSCYGIPVLDGYSSITINPHIETQRNLLIPDGTHPNDLGHEVMARRIIGYLKQLF